MLRQKFGRRTFAGKYKRGGAIPQYLPNFQQLFGFRSSNRPLGNSHTLRDRRRLFPKTCALHDLILDVLVGLRARAEALKHRAGQEPAGGRRHAAQPGQHRHQPVLIAFNPVRGRLLACRRCRRPRCGRVAAAQTDCAEEFIEVTVAHYAVLVGDCLPEVTVAHYAVLVGDRRSPSFFRRSVFWPQKVSRYRLGLVARRIPRSIDRSQRFSFAALQFKMRKIQRLIQRPLFWVAPVSLPVSVQARAVYLEQAARSASVADRRIVPRAAFLHSVSRKAPRRRVIVAARAKTLVDRFRVVGRPLLLRRLRRAGFGVFGRSEDVAQRPSRRLIFAEAGQHGVNTPGGALREVPSAGVNTFRPDAAAGGTVPPFDRAAVLHLQEHRSDFGQRGDAGEIGRPSAARRTGWLGDRQRTRRFDWLRDVTFVPVGRSPDRVAFHAAATPHPRKFGRDRGNRPG